MSNYQNAITQLQGRIKESQALNPEHIVRMRLQNRFQTGLDIARHTDVDDGAKRTRQVRTGNSLPRGL